MATSDPIIDAVEVAIATLRGWRGAGVVIDESVSGARGEPFAHDRHFASHSRLVLTLGHVGWRISGGRLSIEGTSEGSDVWYDIAVEAVTAVDRPSANVVVFTEGLSDRVERRTTVTRR